MKSEELSVKEYAKEKNRSEETIRRWIRKGKLSVRRVGKSYLIPPMEQYANELIGENEWAPLSHPPSVYEIEARNQLRQEQREKLSQLTEQSDE